MFLLKEEDVQRMAYKNHDAVTYEYGHEKKMLKKFNRKIIRNYILFTLLGAAVTAQAFLSAKNPEIMKKMLLADAIIFFVGSSVASVSASVINLIKAEKELKKSVYY